MLTDVINRKDGIKKSFWYSKKYKMAGAYVEIGREQKTISWYFSLCFSGIKSCTQVSVEGEHVEKYRTKIKI